MAEALGCPVVHLDEVYPGWDGLEAGVALATTHVLEPLARGEPAAYPRWDWMRSRPGPHRPRGAAHPPRARGLRCARAAGRGRSRRCGCGSTRRPSVRKERALSRDGETYAPHWDRWAAQEDAVYAAARPWETADLVLRTVAS